ncbi:MAG: glycosyltransferase family 39 protein, partial [Chloroflexi bacterium]|nr:glycosyltransferase family 39 protein [Chloroflexota bacterium]
MSTTPNNSPNWDSDGPFRHADPPDMTPADLAPSGAQASPPASSTPFSSAPMWRPHLALGHGKILLALALAGLAQYRLDERSSLNLAIAAYIGAAVVYALPLGTRAFPPVRTGHPRPASDCEETAFNLRRASLYWALALSALAMVSLGGNRFTPLGAASWLLAIVHLFWATPITRARASAPASSASSVRRVPWPTIALLIALGAGAFLRFYRLQELPADLGWDLPYNFSDGQRILAGEYLIFFPDNYGREGMFFYLIAAVAKLGSLSAYSIRVTSALVGVLAIPAIYALAREALDDEAAAYAALLLASNKWHITLTRSGYRVSLMPLFSILALYTLARALRRGHSRDWALAGVSLGLGLWTYKAFTFMLPTAVGTVLLYALLGLRVRRGDPAVESGRRATFRPLLKGLGLMLLATLVALSPMVRFVIDFPETYLARELLGADLVNKSVERADMSRLSLYARNAITSLLMFNYEGDGNSRFGVPFQRHMGYISGVLFVLGVAGALAHWRRRIYLLLLVALVGLLTPMTISMLAGEAPNCFRSSGVIGPALVLAAIALRRVRRALSAGLRRLPCSLQISFGQAVPLRIALRPAYTLLPILLCAGLLWAEAQETRRVYFDDFRRVAPDVANYSISLELARRIAAFADGPAYIKPWPHWYDGRAVQEHLSAAGVHGPGELFELDPAAPPFAGFQGKMLILFHPQDREALETLKTFFPRHTVLTDH